MGIEGRFNLEPALREFFDMREKGLTREGIIDLYKRWEEKEGPEYRQALQSAISRYAVARQKLSRTV
jgi:hypothetical protein